MAGQRKMALKPGIDKRSGKCFNESMFIVTRKKLWKRGNL